MSDGAHLGITAKRALDTVLGGADQPSEDERSTPAETRSRLEAAPLFEGPTLWETDRDEAYAIVADALGHAFLVLIEEDETLLAPRFYPDTHEYEWMRGKTIDPSSVLWNAMKERWPQADDWCGGASGFQVGFALNAALYALGKDFAAPNPAIVEVNIPDST